MIRTGIWKISQINTADDVKGFFGGTRRISVALYKDLVTRTDNLVELLLLNYADSRGAYKRTYKQRFAKFDQACINCLKDNFQNNQPLLIFDVGVSDGRTSCDFFARASAEFSHIVYNASDYETEIRIRRDGKLSVAISKNGALHEIVYPPFVFNLSKIESVRLYPFNHLALFLARRRVRHLLDTAVEHQFETVKLFCPDATQLAAMDSRFLLSEHNLLEPMQETVNVIRAMNVLNSAYFTSAQMGQIASHFYDALENGGLVIFGSNETPDSIVRGGIYRKTSGGFTAIDTAMLPIEMNAELEKFKA